MSEIEKTLSRDFFFFIKSDNSSSAFASASLFETADGIDTLAAEESFVVPIEKSLLCLEIKKVVFFIDLKGKKRDQRALKNSSKW